MMRMLCVAALSLSVVAGCGGSTGEGEPASESMGWGDDASQTSDAVSADQGLGVDTATGLDRDLVGDVSVDEGQEPRTPGPSEEAIEWRAATGACEAPEVLPADPLLLVGRATPEVPPKPNGSPSHLHLTDITIDPENGRLYAAGLPSLVIMDPGEETPLTLGSVRGRTEHVAWAGTNRVALTSRGHASKPSSNQDGGGGQGGKGLKEPGVYLVDVSDPGSPSKLGFAALEDASGMALFGGYLHVLTHAGALHTFDISEDADPEPLHEMGGLGNPWNIQFQGGYAYVADNSLGLVVLDVSSPAAPSIHSVVSSAGGAQALALDGSVLYLALGSKGIEAFDLSTPDAPVSLGLTGVAGAAISVSASEGLIWYATQQGIGVLDGADPAALVSLGFEETPSWAMAVASVGETAYLADWRTIDVFRVLPEVASPEADFERDECVFVGATEEMEVRLQNRGAGALEIFGASVDDPRVEVALDTLVVPPNEAATVRLRFLSDGDALDADLCLATNDPDGPVQRFPVTSASSDPNAMVGEPAPDFTLTDLDGVPRQLSQELGHPVVLSFFATW